MVNIIKDNDFSKVEGEKAAVVDFSATWCGPCKMTAPVFDALSDKLSDKVAFYNCDVDENPQIAAQFGISSVPTLILFKEGKAVDASVGFVPEAALMSWLEERL